MSVTIVSTLSKPAPAATPEKGASNDSTAASPDFASLLLGQLPPVIPDIVPLTAVTTDSKNTDPTAGDATAMLAALGIIPADAVRNNAQVKTGESGTAGAGAARTELKTSGLPASAQGATSAATLLPASGGDAAAKSEDVPSAVSSSDAKPAIFAAPVSIPRDAQDVKTAALVADSVPSTSALAPGHATNATVHPAPASETALALPTPVRDQNWGNDFAQKVVWLATNDKQSAQITLNPPQMGPIEISVNIDKGGATASFMSANAEVRDAIETAMPRLREMFASAGIELGQTNVSAESFRQQSGNQEDNRSTAQWKADNAILVGANGARAASGLGIQRGNGLVDLFA